MLNQTCVDLATTTTTSTTTTTTIVQLEEKYDELKFVLDDAVSDHPNNGLKNFYKIKQRFGWFNDYVDSPCANPAGAGPGRALRLKKRDLNHNKWDFAGQSLPC